VALAGGDFARADHIARQLAAVLQSLEEPPLLLISSDMNHFATDQENRRLDQLALQAMESGDAERLLRTCQEHAISMCGVFPAAIVMRTLQLLGQPPQFQRLGYATSADATGDTSRVVGYAGMLLI
jgi:AmmeMemoRadiSam system protein B